MKTRNRLSRFTRFSVVLLITLVTLSLFAGEAGAVLKRVGPINNVTTVPTWYQGTDNLALQLCLDQNGFCLLTGPFDPAVTNPPDPITTTGPINDANFPDESFYFNATSTIVDLADSTKPGTPQSAVLGLAMEASFLTGVSPGTAITFLRVNLKQLDGLTPNSTYTVTHPYGTFQFQTDGAGTASAQGGAAYRAEDLSGPPDYFSPEMKAGTLTGIGPFLRSASGLLVVGDNTYIGDPGTPDNVVGSPTGVNFFRIDGPGIKFGGGNRVETTLFSLAGRVFTGPIGTPLTVDRATYARDATTTQIDVFATTETVSNLGTPSVLRVSGDGIDNTTMAMDTNGNAFAHIVLPNPVLFPDNVTVTNISDNNTVPTFLVADLVDDVKVLKATYNPIDNTLRIRAASRDKLVPPTLTAVGFTPALDGTGSLTVPNLPVPPSSVTVVSPKGGGDTAWVTVGSISPFPGLTPPVADFDGDGKADIAVWRQDTGYWYIVRSSDNVVVSQQWGLASVSDVPVPDDYDGDGITDFAVWRQDTGYWYITRSSDNVVVSQQWGLASVSDVPVPDDYDGDGKTDIAVWRKDTGYWYILRSSDGGVTSRQWGLGSASDVPVRGR